MKMRQADGCMIFSSHEVNEDSALQHGIITDIMEQRWNTVYKILCSYQFIDEIKSNNTSHDPTLLHLVCSQAYVPYKIVENILQIYGKSNCLIKDEDGNLPIHIACTATNIDVQILQLLLKTSPDTGEK